MIYSLPLMLDVEYTKDILSSLLEEYPEYNKSEILNMCITGYDPLTYAVEIDVEASRKSFCLSKPWRSSSWFIRECDVLCREFLLKEEIS
tara:strand:+ start:220 stop:489 length:270 start_codon:yes stop_codon:yes gene_type:complete